MDSPSDLSPNAPPAGFDDPFKNNPDTTGSNNSRHEHNSTEGSVDSSGFEKIEHDPLEEYGHNFAQQMQQSFFGQLPEDPDSHDDDFVIIPNEPHDTKMEGDVVAPEAHQHVASDVPNPYSSHLEDEIAPHHTSIRDVTPEQSELLPKTPSPSPAPRSRETTPDPLGHVKTSESPLVENDLYQNGHKQSSPLPEDRTDGHKDHSPSPMQKEPSPIHESSPAAKEASPALETLPEHKELSSPLETQKESNHVADHQEHKERTPSPLFLKDSSPEASPVLQHATPSPKRSPSPPFFKDDSPPAHVERTPSPTVNQPKEKSFTPESEPREPTLSPVPSTEASPVHDHSESKEPTPSPIHSKESSPSPVEKGPSPSPAHSKEASSVQEHHQVSKEPSPALEFYNPYTESPIGVQHIAPLAEERPEEETKQHHDSFAMDAKHLTNLEDHHHVPSDDLIHIPRNDSPPRHEYHHDPHGYDAHRNIDIPRSDSPPIPEPVSHQHQPFRHDSPEIHHEHHRLPQPDYSDEEHPEPVSYQHEPGHHHHPYADDLANIDLKAKELVDDAVKEAGDKMDQHYKEATHIRNQEVAEDVQNQVNSVHNEVDDILGSMNDNDNFQEVVKAQTKDSDEELEPDFRRTPEPEERPHERHGPLTIPEIPDSQEEEPDPVPSPQVLHNAHRHGFETEPRPPTPPKDISDEDVKPSLVNLGHGHHTHTHSDAHHSILKHGSSNREPWVDFKRVDPCILDLVYWRDPKKSAIALSLTLLAVFVLAKYPLLSILSYTGLAVLAGTLGFRLFKAVEAQIKKTNGENPFQEYLNKDLNVPQEKAHAQADVLVDHGIHLLNKLKKLVFVENIFESVKFVLLLWSMTYVSAWFSGFALVILTVLGAFTIPKVYETYQEPIDQQISVISGHINNVVNLVEEKLPFLKRQVEVEKKEQ